jgi:hypothetical protein
MTHLTCPFCPAQGYPSTMLDKLWVGGFKAFQPIHRYVCPAGHVFYVEPEETKDADSLL